MSLSHHHTASPLGTQNERAKEQEELAALQARIASLEKMAEAKTEPRSQQLHETFVRGVYTSDISEDRSRRAVSEQAVRLVDSLEQFLHGTLHRNGGIDGDMCRSMMVAFFIKHSAVLKAVLTEMQVNTTPDKFAIHTMQYRWVLC